MVQKRLTAHFSGMVQGVGFRFTTERIARNFQVTGSVRNLPSGQGELVAEGEEESVKDFLQAVCDSPMAHYIRDVKTQWGEPEGKFKHFSVGT